MAKKIKIEEEFSKTGHLVKRILRDYVSRHTLNLIMALIFMIVAAAMTGAVAKMMEPIIDDIFTEHKAHMLWPVALIIFAIFFFKGISTYAHTVLMNKVGQGIIADVQRDMFERLIRADLAFFHKTPSGQLIARMISDSQVMRNAVAQSLTGIGKSFFTLLFLIAVMIYQDWKLTLIVLFIFPLTALFVSRLNKRLRRVATDTQVSIADLSSILSQVFQGARHVKAYGMEAYEKERSESLIERIFKLSHKTVKVSSIATPVSETLGGAAFVILIVYGGYQVIEGHSTSGKLFSFITAFMLAYEPMKKLAKLSNLLQIGLAAADRVFSIIDMPSEIKEKEDAKTIETQKPNISLEQVSFVYPDGTEVLDKISLEVPAGKTAALVGPSGSGKSTIINLIPRFYDINGGTVKIDNEDIRDITISSLRSNMALVSQEVAVFNDSVRDNIRYGSMEATEADIINAAKFAAAHDFIESLPEGYDTVIGEQGVKLSGGQRQRISIARAMLRNAPILLLDEATSALDTESEQAVQAALDKLQEGRTTLVVAHRLSTIKNADIIYVLDKGQVVESGTHAELLDKNGLYARLYSS